MPLNLRMQMAFSHGDGLYVTVYACCMLGAGASRYELMKGRLSGWRIHVIEVVCVHHGGVEWLLKLTDGGVTSLHAA